MLSGSLRRVAIAASLVAVCLFVLAAVAFAAHPKKGKSYKGTTDEAALNGFKPPVTFKVSADGTELSHFDWAGVSCIGGGGFGTGDPWHGSVLYKVGTIKVKSNGSFSVKNVSYTYKYPSGSTQTTRSTITGKFKSAGKASGTIKFSQKFSDTTQTCSFHHTFTAKVA